MREALYIDTQHQLVSKKQAVLNWWQRNDKKIQKWVFRILMIALAIYIFILSMIGLAQGLAWVSEKDKVEQLANQESLGVAPIIVLLIAYAVLYMLWKWLIFPFLNILNTCQDVFVAFGGKGIIQTVINTQKVGEIVGIFVGVAATLIILFICVRGIKMAATRNAEKQESIARGTPLAIFGAVIGIFVMTAAFLFFIGILCQVVAWVIDAMGINNQHIGTMIYNYSQWTGIGNETEIPMIDPWIWILPVNPTHSVLMMTLLGIAGAAFIFRCLISLISNIFKIVVLYITSFVALGKWPQDEGAAFNAHKDDLIGCMLQYVFLFFLFNMFMILFTLITPIARSFPESQKTFFIPGVICCAFFAGGTIAIAQLTKRLPMLFSLQKSPDSSNNSQNISSSAKAVYKNASSKGNKVLEKGVKQVTKEGSKAAKTTTKKVAAAPTKIAK